MFTEITTGTSKEMPAKAIIYGVPKIGKSRFCAEIPDAFFINVEDGLDYVGKEIRATPKLTAFKEVIAWLNHIIKDDDFKAGAIVIDSLDWVEKLAQADLCEKYGADNLSDPACKPFAYHKGYVMAAEETNRVFTALDMIYKNKGIKSFIICHSQIKNIDLPNKDPFSQYNLKLYKDVASKAFEWADLVLFADYEFHVTKDGATSDPKPALFAGGSASFVGGGRMLLKKTIPLNYQQLKKEITS